jgi:hypothetical protein
MVTGEVDAAARYCALHDAEVDVRRSEAAIR